MDNVTNPHDKLFRETWSDRENAQSFLTHYLPKEVSRLIDLDTLEICKDSFIEKELQDYFSDILYQVNLKSKQKTRPTLAEGYVYVLFEHKSYPERLIHLQMLEYESKIWRLFLKQKKTCQKDPPLPIIIPIVLTHGKQKWTVKTKFSEMLAGPREALASYIPDFEYIHYDLTRYSDAEIKGTVLCRIVILLFKHIFDPDLHQQLPRIFSLMKDLLKREDGLHCIEMILRYVMSTAENITRDQLTTMVNQSLAANKGDMVMTLAEKLIQEGYEKGKRESRTIAEKLRQEGRQEGLLEGIELGLTLKFGDEGKQIMPSIRSIHNLTHLETIKDAIKHAQDISELKTIVDNLSSMN